MRIGPDIAAIGALLGDPARANMLTALMGGIALTAGELAREAGVTPQTASSHLRRLTEGGLVNVLRQGRHAYYTLADEGVAEVLEALMGRSAVAGGMRTRPGPKEPALRRARVCYDHLAGDLGVELLDSLTARGLMLEEAGTLILTPAGGGAMRGLGVDPEALAGGRRPLCRPCLDWSVRRNHLGGALGKALLEVIYARGWARRLPGSRVVAFSAPGLQEFRAAFGALSPSRA